MLAPCVSVMMMKLVCQYPGKPQWRLEMIVRLHRAALRYQRSLAGLRPVRYMIPTVPIAHPAVSVESVLRCLFRLPKFPSLIFANKSRLK